MAGRGYFDPDRVSSALDAIVESATLKSCLRWWRKVAIIAKTYIRLC